MILNFFKNFKRKRQLRAKIKILKLQIAGFKSTPPHELEDVAIRLKRKQIREELLEAQLELLIL